MKLYLLLLHRVAVALLRGDKLFLSRTSAGWVNSRLMSSAETNWLLLEARTG